MASSIPGFNSFGSNEANGKPDSSVTTLQPYSEWRFEVPQRCKYSVKLLKGTAEIFGTEIALGPEYVFSNYKGAIYTWHGCTFEYKNISKNGLGFTIGLGNIRGSKASSNFKSTSAAVPNMDFLPGGGLEGSTVDDEQPKTTEDSTSASVPADSADHSANPEPVTEALPKKSSSVISESVSEESQMPFYANLHFAFENIRQSPSAASNDSSAPEPTNTATKAPKVQSAPRVLVIGPQDSGKTSLCKVLVSYDCKRGRTPLFINLDPLESVFCAPGALSATVVGDILDVEQGWGGSAITGPALFHPKQPLVRFFGLDNPMKNHKYFNQIVRLLAKDSNARISDDAGAKESGIYIDTPSVLVSPENKDLGYSMIQHIISEFGINILLVMGDEALYNDMKKQVSATEKSSPVTVVNVPKSGGTAHREPEFMVSLQSRLINEYFYGTPKQPLSPYTVTVDYSLLSIYRIAENKLSENGSLILPKDGEDAEEQNEEDDDYYELYNEEGKKEGKYLIKLEPSSIVENGLLAVMDADIGDSIDVIAKSAVRCFVHVVEADDNRKKMRILMPIHGRLPTKPFVLGDFRYTE